MAHLLRIAVIGAGLVGARHVRLVAEHEACQLAAIIDPAQSAYDLAREMGAQHYNAIEDVPENMVDAAIVATPNANHLPTARACAKRRWACLMEKPIADTLENGQEIIDVFDAANLPLLIGHHRRYHPFVQRARALLDNEELGKPIIASMIWAVRKPDEYFAKGAWRLNADGGPILINLIHEIDLMHCLFGRITEVQALVSTNARAGDVEDTAAISMRFQSGMLASIALSDAALTPWSFEGASNENPTIAETGISPWRIGCTQGAFEFPSLTMWRDAAGGEGDWSKPLGQDQLATHQVTPLKEQLSHFIALAQGHAKTPIVCGQDGLAAVRVVAAIQEAVVNGTTVKLQNWERAINKATLTSTSVPNLGVR